MDHYLNFALPKSGKPRHRFVRALFGLYRKTASSVFIQAVERALQYRVTDIKVIENIVFIILQDGCFDVTLPEIDPDFQSREAYIEGCFADEIDLSIYDRENEFE
jgi:hypothetical protein